MLAFGKKTTGLSDFIPGLTLENKNRQRVVIRCRFAALALR